ncbi:MAG: acyl-CoA reductase [Elusimicrobiota bacterium]|jgi:phenylacetate-coenzyme A ligase PaaK-like adenylate-forming protein
MKSRFVFGRWEQGGPLTTADAERICASARKASGAFASYPVDKTLRLLGRLSKKWASPSFGPRVRAEKALPGITGFSLPMVKKGLEELCWTLNPDLLAKKLDTELRAGEPKGLIWEPLGVVLHVLAGNVFVGEAGALVEGLITRNVTLLKMPSADTFFLPEFLRTLADLDEDGVVSASIAAVEYGSGQADVMAAFKSRVDGIAVWGGESSVRAYRDGLPARTRLVVFGPKISLAVITKEGLNETALTSTARKLAVDVSTWDQNACTAPQVCYVQGEALAKKLVEALPTAFQEEAGRLPPGDIARDNAVEIQKLRSVFEVAEARGQGLLRRSPKALDWTVVLDRDQTLEPSPLHRTLWVIPFKDMAEVTAQLESLRGYIQTVGLTASQAEAAALAPRLARAGALRVLELGRMGTGEIDDPHDGQHDLPQLMNAVLIRLAQPAGKSLHMPVETRRDLIDSRLRVLIEKARRSEFYGKRLRGLKIETAADLAKVPVLTREEMEANMPPQGEGLATGPWAGGYVSRSGGSTGEPKFSVYDRHDWDAMIGHAVDLFRAMGLTESDRLANFMLAGDLYGSFVSFDHINARLGLTSFAFAGSSTPETFVRVWRKFRINAAMGIPSNLIPFLRKAKGLEPRLRLAKLVYAGTPLSPSDHDWLKAELGLERVASVIGANDGGQIGYQCPAQRGRLHHAMDEFNYIEIVDEKGRPVKDGEPGRIVITSLLKRAYPLIRYELGDAARIVPGPCSCKGTARVLEHLGRSDDALCVGMLNVRYRDFEAALRAFPVSALQVAASNDARGESLVVRVETAAKTEGLASRMRAALLSSMEKLAERLAEGGLQAVAVELHRPGTLPRNQRSGKLKSLSDERK